MRHFKTPKHVKRPIGKKFQVLDSSVTDYEVDANSKTLRLMRIRKSLFDRKKQFPTNVVRYCVHYFIIVSNVQHDYRSFIKYIIW